MPTVRGASGARWPGGVVPAGSGSTAFWQGTATGAVRVAACTAALALIASPALAGGAFVVDVGWPGAPAVGDASRHVSVYAPLFAEGRWLAALAGSAGVGLFAAVAATVLGMLAALWLDNAAPTTRKSVAAAAFSPALTPVAVSATLLVVFHGAPVLRSTYAGLVVGHVVIGLPLALVAVLATASRFDPALTRAAKSLGAGRWQRLRRIRLPFIWPGVAIGALLALTASLGDMVVAFLMAGLAPDTVPFELASATGDAAGPGPLAAAALLVALALLLPLVADRLRGAAFSRFDARSRPAR